jgi:outer membrane receptor protein involved in Fe transport
VKETSISGAPGARSEVAPAAPPPAPVAAAEPAAPPAAAAVPAPAPEKPLGEDIVVTATRGARAQKDVPAATTVIRRSEIEQSPTKTADELLRAVPSFGLFRRSSSVAADPSSQGVALRGIGPSGVSRSLVLVDGVPANDPFGGWVYWRALPRVSMERIEVVPGGGSALYGNYALGGVTQVFSSPIVARQARGFAEVGSFDDLNAGLRASERLGPVGVAVEAEGLRSHGYPVVAPSQRGAIDGSTPSTDVVVNARAEAAATDDLTLRARAGYFYEDWNGGTRWTSAGVKRLDYGTGARWAAGSAGSLDVSLFGQVASFTQSRGRPNATRTTEVQSAWQDVPAHDLGASAIWTSGRLELGGGHTLTAGTDGRRITGTTHEDLYPATVTPTSVVRRDAGGTQWLYGLFAQDVYDVTPLLSLHAALRWDGWVNADGTRQDRASSGVVTPFSFARRTDEQLSPKLGAVLRPAAWLTLRASAYQAFRAPTLNELYRPFQVGTTRTDPNAALGPEKLDGAEAGVDVAPLPGLTTRVTGFWTELKDPITNVTLSTSPGLTVRQRQNLGAARVQGVEASVAQRLARVWLASAGYTYADSRVTDAPGQPQLVGKDLPQDPRHRVVASLSYDDPRVLTAGVQARYLSVQYEDDLNTARMKEFVLVDLSVSRRVTRNLEVVLAVENLLDRQYTVGLAGVETIGQPRFVHGGVRFTVDR